MRTLNLRILAYVDAAKTSLTERLLHTAGVIDEVGSVDDGSSQTDTLALEQERGITIKSDVVDDEGDDVAINLIETPGHPDFIAEVERVLGVLDGAVVECGFDGARYEPAEGEPPTRPRTDHNPVDREEYLLRVAGLVKG